MYQLCNFLFASSVYGVFICISTVLTSNRTGSSRKVFFIVFLHWELLPTKRRSGSFVMIIIMFKGIYLHPPSPEAVYFVFQHVCSCEFHCTITIGQNPSPPLLIPTKEPFCPICWPVASQPAHSHGTSKLTTGQRWTLTPSEGPLVCRTSPITNHANP